MTIVVQKWQFCKSAPGCCLTIFKNFLKLRLKWWLLENTLLAWSKWSDDLPKHSLYVWFVWCENWYRSFFLDSTRHHLCEFVSFSIKPCESTISIVYVEIIFDIHGIYFYEKNFIRISRLKFGVKFFKYGDFEIWAWKLLACKLEDLIKYREKWRTPSPGRNFWFFKKVNPCYFCKYLSAKMWKFCLVGYNPFKNKHDSCNVSYFIKSCINI